MRLGVKTEVLHPQEEVAGLDLSGKVSFLPVFP
jgi:hypothetical protein